MRRTALLLAVFIGSTSFALDEVLKGATDMTGDLARAGAQFFDEAVRSELDAVNRELRDSQNAFNGAKDEAGRVAAMERRNKTAVRLGELLEACPGKLPIALAAQNAVFPAITPVELPGDSGVLLFRVDAGDGPQRCALADFDFAKVSHPRLPIRVTPGCVTWVLVRFAHVPQLKTAAELEFSSQDDAKTLLPLTITSAQPGTLALRVVSAETGRPVPAMVRIVRKLDNHFVEPPNATDFAPLFDSQGSATARRNANLPGRLAGSCWCIPGPFTATVSPGEYEVVVHIGIEYLPAFDTITIVSGQTTEREYTLRRWENMAKKGWYSGDDHVHCQILSDSDAETLMTWIKAEDIHVANVVKMGDIYRTWFEQRGFGPKYRVQDGDRVLSPGQECPRTHDELGHTLHMNIKNMIRNTDQYYLYDTVFDEVQRQGGLSGYAHANSGIFHVHRDMSINIPKGKVDFVELLQFAAMGTDLYYEFLNLGFKVTASAGSDVPWGGTVGEVRSYAYLGKKKFSVDRWFEAVGKGRTFVTNGVMLEFTVDDALPGDEIVVDGSKDLRVHAKAWGSSEYAVPTKLEIVACGESVKQVNSSDPKKSEISVDFVLPSGNGFWIAAMADGSDGSKAHTTPVYVVRKGLRFWKYDAVDDLIAKRMTSLAEVDALVADTVEKDKRG
ncbi:MAG: CehA/McbA family metallohydrolase, partial [Candidatus Hydrogenedentales bacterium]